MLEDLEMKVDCYNSPYVIKSINSDFSKIVDYVKELENKADELDAYKFAVGRLEESNNQIYKEINDDIDFHLNLPF